MPMNAMVYLHHGPYDACNLVTHRTERLEGLKSVLLNEGHTLDFVQIPDWNQVELWVNGEMVFTCDIRALDFGSDGLLDPLCADAKKKVMEAY